MRIGSHNCLLGAALIVGLLTGPALSFAEEGFYQVRRGPLATDYYRVVHRPNRKVLEFFRPADDSGTPVAIYDLNRFQFVSVGDGFAVPSQAQLRGLFEQVDPSFDLRTGKLTASPSSAVRSWVDDLLTAFGHRGSLEARDKIEKLAPPWLSDACAERIAQAPERDWRLRLARFCVARAGTDDAEALMDLLAVPHPEIRALVLSRLRAVADDPLPAFIRESDPQVLNRTITIDLERADPKGQALLVGIYENHQLPQARRMALQLLLRTYELNPPRPELIEQAFELARGGDPALRAVVVEALTYVDDPKVDALQLELLEDDRAKVRERAAWGVQQRRPEGAAPALLDALATERNLAVVRTLTAALDTFPDPRVAKVVTARLEQGADPATASALAALLANYHMAPSRRGTPARQAFPLDEQWVRWAETTLARADSVDLRRTALGLLVRWHRPESLAVINGAAYRERNPQLRSEIKQVVMAW